MLLQFPPPLLGPLREQPRDIAAGVLDDAPKPVHRLMNRLRGGRPSPRGVGGLHHPGPPSGRVRGSLSGVFPVDGVSVVGLLSLPPLVGIVCMPALHHGNRVFGVPIEAV